MKRKLIQLARKTLVLSLPADWTKKHDLKKGDEIHVEEKNNKLIIKCSKNKAPYETSFHAPNSSLVKQMLADLYIRGFDKITITFKDPVVIEYILQEQLIGFEIIEQTNQKVVLKNIAQIDEQEFDNVLRRLFLLTKQITEQGAYHLEGKQTSILALEKQSNKLSNYARRLLNRYGFEPEYKVHHLYSIITDLERLGDIYKYLAKNNIESFENARYFINIHKFYSKLYEQCYNYKQKDIEDIYKQRSELLESLSKIKHPMIKHYALAATRQTYHLIGPIIAINS